MNDRHWLCGSGAGRKRSSLFKLFAALIVVVGALVSRPAAAAPGDTLAQAAQKGVDFLVPDVVNWTNWNGCIACHRQGAALYGMAVAKNAGFTVNMSNADGVGYVAQAIAQNQGGDGSWDWGSLLKTSYTFYGLAGYDAFVSTAYANNVVAAADWALTVQNPDGHWWLDFDDGITAHGDITVTARMMVGIAQAKQRVDATKAAAYQAALDKGAAYITAHKDDTSDYSGVGTVYEMAWAIVGAKAAGLADNHATIVSLIASLQASKSNLGYAWGQYGGWGPDAFDSGLAVYALCQAGVPAIGNQPLLQALDWLNQQQQTWDDSWGNDINTTFAVLGLACYGEYGVVVTSVGPLSQIISSNSPNPQTITYTFDVQNRGFQNDTYDLSVVGGMVGWTTSLQSYVTVPAGGHQNVTLTVHAPANLPEALPVQMTVVATSQAVSTVSTQARITTYTDPPPPTSGDSTSVTLVGGNGGSVMLGQSINLQASVTDTSAGTGVHGPGKGVVTFFVAGLAVGIDSDADGNGVYSFTFTPDCSWNLLGTQDFRAIYSGIDLPSGQTDMLSSLAAGSITMTAPACCPKPETCNGKDDDCDGVIDNGFNVGTACSAGVGECSASGTIQCTSPSASACNAVAGSPQAETCDGKDNDCDGVVDNGNPGAGAACSTGLPGACASGTTACSSGAISCVPSVMPGAQTEICDGIDNDCDGSIDEGFNVGSACAAGIGECLRAGSVQCTAQGTSACNAVAGSPQAETCDGKDNDCDGVVDNGFNVGAACTNGVGECQRSGNVQCTAQGTATCNAVPGAPQAEACDGKDNDCDGVVDNGNPGAGVACSTGLSGVCASGSTTCNAGAIACVPSVMPGAQAETCDGLDNDCDGVVDNAFNVGAACTNGVGACAKAGAIICQSDGTAACDAVPGIAQTEICGDAVDSDCDGTSDNGCACLTDEVCGDAASGAICDTGAGASYTCITGCRGASGNGCPAGLRCTSADSSAGACVECLADADCGTTASGKICDPSTNTCLGGCRGQDGNGCVAGLVCTSTDGSAGACVECLADADCGNAASGKICDPSANACRSGCHGQDGNGCVAGFVCTSTDGSAGACVQCVADADCGPAASGRACDTVANTCVAGCRGQNGNGCASDLVCTSTDGNLGVCVSCVVDADCGESESGQVCDVGTHACKQGCRGEDGNGCAPGFVCTSSDGSVGACVQCNTDTDCGDAASGKVCDATTNTCKVGCREGGNGCPAGKVCTSSSSAAGACVGCVTDADCGDATSGKVCDASTLACVTGCRGVGGNGCTGGLVCSSSDGAPGKCVGCVADANCGIGQVCDPATQACLGGCRTANGCGAGLVCSSTDGSAGSCVQCASDADCGDAASGEVCVNHLCSTGCRGSSGNGCPSGATCSSTGSSVGTCVAEEKPPVATVTDTLPEGAMPGGTGLLCAARPGRDDRGAAWLFGLAIGALALSARRRSR